MDATEGYELLVIGVVLLAVVALAAFYLLRNYRLRRLRTVRGEAATPEAASDRAYNRLALARREADVLAAQGGDVEQARQLIDLAGRSLDARSFDRAYELAQAAHETLVRARREPPHGPSPKPEPTPATPAAPRAAVAPTAPAPPGAAFPPQVARSRAEAQFELRLFEQDLAEAAKSAQDPAQAAGARQLYVQAHAAFDRAEYQEAFRLALRGRRQVGGHVEALGPSTSPAPPASGPGAPAADPAQSAEEVAAQERCPLCGHPTVPGDAFCRGCGAARTPSVCSACGAPRKPTDAFCGRCGQRYG